MPDTLASTPRRIQRSRQKGSRLPEGTVCVTRPSRWGNPFRVGDPHPERYTCFVNTNEEAVRHFRPYAEAKAAAEPDWLAPLRGKNLACWCPVGAPCHAEVLLELANAPVKTSGQ